MSSGSRNLSNQTNSESKEALDTSKELCFIHTEPNHLGKRHTNARCFQQHPELKKDKPNKKKADTNSGPTSSSSSGSSNPVAKNFGTGMNDQQFQQMMQGFQSMFQHMKPNVNTPAHSAPASRSASPARASSSSDAKSPSYPTGASSKKPDKL